MSNHPGKLDSLIIYVIQMNITWKNKHENLRRIYQLLNTVKPESGAMVILPEMFNSGFCMDAEEICEEPGGKTEKTMSELASRYKIFIIAGIPLRAEERRGMNAAVGLAPNGQVVFRFAKLHPFSPANEENFYLRGKEILIVEYSGWKISPFICYDLRFPESYRSAALEGAELLITIANWPEERARHWIPLLQARAIENLCYVAGVNRVGSSPEHNYTGESVILSPWGEFIVKAGSEECVLRAELSKEMITDIRKNFPCLEDARLSLKSEVKYVKI